MNNPNISVPGRWSKLLKNQTPTDTGEGASTLRSWPYEAAYGKMSTALMQFGLVKLVISGLCSYLSLLFGLQSPFCHTRDADLEVGRAFFWGNKFQHCHGSSLAPSP